MILLLVTLSSMLLAGIMSLIAWRIAREEHHRSDARVAALAAEIHHVDRIDRVDRVADLNLRPLVSTPVTGDLFAATEPRSGSRLAAAIAVGVLVVGSIGSLAVVLSPASRSPDDIGAIQRFAEMGSRIEAGHLIGAVVDVPTHQVLAAS